MPCLFSSVSLAPSFYRKEFQIQVFCFRILLLALTNVTAITNSFILSVIEVISPCNYFRICTDIFFIVLIVRLRSPAALRAVVLLSNTVKVFQKLSKFSLANFVSKSRHFLSIILLNSSHERGASFSQTFSCFQQTVRVNQNKWRQCLHSRSGGASELFIYFGFHCLAFLYRVFD